MASSVLQGSVLVSLLFIVSLNDLDENVQDIVTRYADDTKVAGL